MRITVRVFATLLLSLSAAFGQGAAANAARIDQVLTELQQVHSFSRISVSPDGNWVAWSQPAAHDGSNTEIFVLRRKEAEAKPRRLTAGDGKGLFRESDVAWSPDSSQIAFLSNAGSSQEQVFVTSIPGGKARRLTDLKGYITDPEWAPDGTRIAFLYAENGGGGGPLEAVPAQTGAIESEIHNQRLTVVNAAGDTEPHQLSPAELNIYEYNWSPDGNRFAAIAAPGPADNNWWIAQLYSCDASSGQMQVLYHPPAERQLALPRWSPDGKQIAFIGGLMSDQGFNGGDIFLISAKGTDERRQTGKEHAMPSGRALNTEPVLREFPGSSSGGEPRDVTRDRKTTPTWLAWRNDGELIFTEDVDGASAISSLRIANGESETLWKGTQQLHDGGNYPNFSLAKDGKTSALIRSSWEQASEVWAGPIGNWQQLTHENATQRPHWGKAESVIWDNEGLRVQGWLLYPVDYDASKRYPMIVEIHGGPSNMRSNYWPTAHFDMSSMAALGYFVFFPNPRGSYGEGEAFTRANVKDFGGGDLRDILSGLDSVMKKVPVDANRIGVTGWSYGGFMTMWTVTQTTRFHAAVAGAGIADWLSYYGQNSIDEWMIPFFGASVYNDPAVYAKSSPITFIKQVKTPTLVIVGERDGECPAPQSFEFWHALKTLGVPAQLVVYPGEGHAFHLPNDDLDRLRRTLGWFDRYLGTPNSAASTQ